MGYRTGQYPIHARQREMTFMSGRITFAGSGTLDATKTKGSWFTFTRNGAGDYTLKIDDVFPDLFNIAFTLYKASSTGAAIFVTSDTVATDGKIRFTYQENTAGTFAAADPASGTSLGFMVSVRNTSLKS